MAEDESSDEELDNLLAQAYANKKKQEEESETSPTATVRRSKSPPKKPRYENTQNLDINVENSVLLETVFLLCINCNEMNFAFHIPAWIENH